MSLSTAPASDLVDFAPDPIVFGVRLREQALTTLTLTNVSDADVAYKVKTTAPRRYCVRPNSDVLPVGTTIDVELVLQAFDLVPEDAGGGARECRDKFQLLVAPLPAGVAATFADKPAKIWETVRRESTRQAKFKVALHLLGGGAAEGGGEGGGGAAAGAPVRHGGVAVADPEDTGRSHGHVVAGGGEGGGGRAVAAAAAPSAAPPPLDKLVSAPEYKSAAGRAAPRRAVPPAPPLPPIVPAPPSSPERVGAAARPPSLSPRSRAALERAPSVEERKDALAEGIAARQAELEAAAVAERASLHSPGTSVERRVGVAEGRDGRARREREEAAARRREADAEREREREAQRGAAPVQPEAAVGGAEGGSAGSTGTDLLYATAFADAAAMEEAAVEAARARVLAGRAAPAVEVRALSEADAQRAAVERAEQLVRLSAARDAEMAAVAAQLAEANHKLADAKMAVLPAYDVKYEVDEHARIPLTQIALMAAVSGVVLMLLV